MKDGRELVLGFSTFNFGPRNGLGLSLFLYY